MTHDNQQHLYQNLAKLQGEAYANLYPEGKPNRGTYGQSQITSGYGTLPQVRYTSGDPLGMDFIGHWLL